MLSTITPMAERTRGRHWWVTVGWFVAGATIGGIGLGVLGAVGALGVSAIGPTPTTALALAVAAALAAAAMDLGVAGPELPHHRRQVDELWLDHYRGWVYGLTFGAQIGSGLATYIMTAGVYLTVVLATLTGEPAAALAIGTLFGFARGLAILLGLRLTDPRSAAAVPPSVRVAPGAGAHRHGGRRAARRRDRGDRADGLGCTGGARGDGRHRDRTGGGGPPEPIPPFCGAERAPGRASGITERGPRESVMACRP